MFIRDIKLLPVISWCILQGCLSQECEYYYYSDIKYDCPILTIEKAWVCYTKIDGTHWTAKITCFRGYHLDGQSIRHCIDDGYLFSDWSWYSGYTKCVRDDTTTTTSTASTATTEVASSSTLRTSAITMSSTAWTVMTSSSPVVTSEETEANYSPAESDKETKSRLVVYVCVSITTMVSIVIGLVIIVCIHRRKKRTTNKVVNSQVINTSSGINDVYDNADVVVPNANDVVGNVESEYVVIPDADDQLIGEDEYNTIHEQERMDNNSNYNHVQMSVQSETYDSTKHSSGNIQGDKERLSHLSITDHATDNSGLNNNAGNVYNTLKADGNFVAMNEQNSSGLESYYDHTNGQTEETSIIELNTYDHVDNGVYANERILMVTRERS